jgi:predicted enzyme related to lactoylglutathione lyase
MALRFVHYELRTRDVSAARAFYPQIVRDPQWQATITVGPLPAAAAAVGAPSHWLGHLGPAHVASTVGTFVAAGGQQLGPLRTSPTGSSSAVIRDPFGAVLAVTDAHATGGSAIAWHLMASRDERAAFRFYSTVCGWSLAGEAELSGGGGRHQIFAWEAESVPVGSVSDLARLPHVHPQWLLFFPVPDLAGAVAAVKRLGGSATEPAATPAGAMTSACEDNCGAAFGLIQRP